MTSQAMGLSNIFKTPSYAVIKCEGIKYQFHSLQKMLTTVEITHCVNCMGTIYSQGVGGLAAWFGSRGPKMYNRADMYNKAGIEGVGKVYIILEYNITSESIPTRGHHLL